MAMNKDTQELLVESVALNVREIADKVHEALGSGDIPIDMMKKVIKLEELRLSLIAKNAGE